MPKGLNNYSEGDFNLPRAKILRGKKNFQHLFGRDVSIVREQYVNLRFQLLQSNTPEVLMGFIVKKQLGKANRRNKIKRLLREAYRRNQHLLYESITDLRFSFHGAFMANQIDFSYDIAEQNIISLLNAVRMKLPDITPISHS